jgi:hypothetical protein
VALMDAMGAVKDAAHLKINVAVKINRLNVDRGDVEMRLILEPLRGSPHVRYCRPGNAMFQPAVATMLEILAN